MPDNDIDFSILTGPQVPTRTFKAGETIFHAGDPATELYVIQEGRVGIQAGNRLLDTLEGKTIFGEMALVDGAPRSATAVAMTDVTVVPVSEKQFLFLVSQTPFFALKVMRVLAGRLRASNKVSFGTCRCRAIQKSGWRCLRMHIIVDRALARYGLITLVEQRAQLPCGTTVFGPPRYA